jgi:tetratricopeptide (TPR) repeat protein
MKWNGRFVLFLLILLPILFGLLLNLSPQSRMVQGLWQKVETSKNKQDYSSILSAYKVLNQLMPWRTSDAIVIADASFQLGDWQETVQAYALVEDSDLSRNDLYQLAEAYWQLNELETARLIWQKIGDLADNEVEDFEHLVQVQQQHQDWFGAYETLLIWQRKHPQDNSFYYALGLSQIIYDPESAHTSLTRALERQHQQVDKIKQLMTALPDLVEEKNSVMRLMFAGAVLSQQNEWAYAAAAYALVVRTVPDYAEAWALYSNALYYLGQDGLKALQTAQSLDANAPLVRAVSGYYLRRESLYTDSLKVWEGLSDEEPDNPLWLFESGMTYALAGDFEEALTAYQNAAEINETDPYYWRELARFCLDYSIGLDSIGLNAARKALSLDPNNSDSNDLMGWIFYHLDDFVSAERFVLKAKNLAPNSALIHLHLGQIYIRQNKLEAAGENLEKSIRLAQNDLIKEQAERLLFDFIKN